MKQKVVQGSSRQVFGVVSNSMEVVSQTR